MARNPYLKCRQMSARMVQTIMVPRGEQARTFDREVRLMTGISGGDGTRPLIIYKQPEITRIRESHPLFCTPGNPMAGPKRVVMAQRYLLTVRAHLLIKNTGTRKSIQI